MLVHVVITLLGAAIALAVSKVTAPPLAWSLAIWVLSVAGIELLVGHAPRGKAQRPVSTAPDTAASLKQLPHWQRWYIESQLQQEVGTHSCSFVEFDERGDYLDFAQHRDAYERIMRLAAAAQPLTVVIYVHGWRHSSQSSDVVAFNEFLHQLAGTRGDDGQLRRVHGVYLAWRGATLKHTISRDETFKKVDGYYGGEIVDFARRAPIRLLNVILESVSYFDRKSVPEHKSSGTAISRTIFSCAFAAKRSKGDRQVLVMGHSFGALMLERTLQNASIGELTEAWPWGQPEKAGGVNPLPFDTILLVNSAAPSIYAKQFQSYLAAHRQAMIRARVPHANIPIVFSVTSSADWATGVAHPLANSLCFLVPTLWRSYQGDDFALELGGTNPSVVIPQSYYYRHTPGHNPLLVNRFIERIRVDASQPEKASQVQRNLTKGSSDLTTFTTATRDRDAGVATWAVEFPPRTAAFNKFSMYRGRRPLVWTLVGDKQIYKETAYWIIRCPKEIITGHNAIWSQPAMDTYAALHRLALEVGPERRVHAY
jgi:hypothetical protein